MKQCPLCKKEMREQLLFCPFDGQTLISVGEADKFLGLILEGKYRIDEKVGEGGMGKVYRATHILMDHTVAIKILHPDLSSDYIAVERFRREARAAASIRHPNAVAVTDFGVIKETGLSYLVMEFLEGIELRDEIKEKKWLDFEESFIIIQQTCSALQAAHAKGIIHRDLKPDNIWLLRSEHGFPHVKVLDFGIAKLKTAEASNLTQQGMIVGTPYYMSPEQCIGDDLDARSDIYSLGIIIYETLTGKVPFRASTPMGVALKHANETPRPPHELRSDLPNAIENVVLRALKKQREDRPASAMELAQEFELALYQAGVELKFLGTKTPQDSHTFTSYLDRAYTQADRSLSPDRSTPPERTTPPDRSISPDQSLSPERSTYTDRTTTPDKSLSSEESTGGASIAVAQPLSAQQPASTSSIAERDFFQQVAQVPLSMLNWLSELPYASKISFIALAAVLVIGAVVSVLVFALREATSVEPSNPGPASLTPPPGMVYIPKGTFTMGYNGSDDESEKPEQEVPVAAFFIDQYEVTIEEYSKFIRARNHEPPKDWPTSWREGKFKPAEARLPATNITWFDARAYAEWAGKRLPSEAEWEYAARGTDKRLFPWGNSFDPKFANVGDPEKRILMPTGSYPLGKTPSGIFDMAGNAYEWTDSDSIPYPNSKVVPKPGKIIRGGSFWQKRVYAMTTTRGILSNDERTKDVGFRCAKDVPMQ